MGTPGGKPGWLSDFVTTLQNDKGQCTETSRTAKVFLTGDSMFLDAMSAEARELAANSKSGV